MAHSDHMLSLSTLPCTWTPEARAMSFCVSDMETNLGSPKPAFPSLSLNLIYVTAFPAKYRHRGWFSRPVAAESLCTPELHL